MRVTDAFWEKRNLGVSTVEIAIDATDSVESIRNILDEVKAQYIVLKIPAGQVDKMWTVEDLGFHFMETVVHVTKNLNDIEMPPLIKRIEAGVSCALMIEEEMEILFEKIREGIFLTDRIYLDPHFTEKQAAERYVNWIKDEVERGTELYKYVYKEQTVGFFALKQIEKDVYYPFLAGIYPEYKNSSLGAVFNYKPMIEAKKRGGKQISTYISTNNPNAVRMHAICGFQFNEISYVYVKHNDE